MSSSSNSQTVSADLLTKLKSNVDFWVQLVEKYVKASGSNAQTSEEKAEYKALSTFINGPLINRLMGIYQEDNPLKERYLKAIEPFYSKEGLKTFIEQHFDLELDPVEDLLMYRKKENFEKDVTVLYMLYKVKKTIETINTLQKSIDSGDPFPSSFSVEMQQDYLSVLKEILKLFFIKFVKKEFVKSVFTKLSEKQFGTTGLATRREKELTYIKEKILAGTQVRQFFILLFFTKEMKTIRQQKVINIAFNYLDFELIKYEFLTDWLQRKLRGNKAKDLIYAKYRINSRTLKELVKENPEKEGEYLAQIPLEEFNDIAEQVNEIVDEEDKTPVPTFSKNHGELARSDSLFRKAKKIARLPLAKISMLLKGKKKSKHPTTTFSVEVVTEFQIDFPFFDEKTNTYENKLTFLKKKLGDIQYENFRNNLWSLFEYIAMDHMIKRDEPLKEWCIPFVLKNGEDIRLLIVGAEISQKKTKSGVKFSDYSFNPYFVYGTNKQDDECGRLLGTRKAKMIEFNCYSYVEEKVQKEAMKFFEYITLQANHPVFKTSGIRFKTKQDRVKTEDLIQQDQSLIQDN